MADELPPAPEGTFSVVVIPDTQWYFGRGTKRGPIAAGKLEPVTNPIFHKETDWIVNNLEKQRVAFVTHVGDIVDKNENEEEWKLAKVCMDKLHGKVPYGISVGNHDMDEPKGDSSIFQKYFPASRFENFDWYGGTFSGKNNPKRVSENNANSYQFFNAQGMEFIILHLECNAPDNVLDWANSVLKKHSDKRAIITSHMGLGPVEKPKKPKDFLTAPKGRMDWKKCHGKNGNTTVEMWKKCYRKHENIFLILSGDQSRSQAVYQSTRGENGNLVHEVLSDYGLDGLRIMHFIPTKNLIQVRTWNADTEKPILSTELVPNAGEHQFVLNYGMK